MGALQNGKISGTRLWSAAKALIAATRSCMDQFHLCLADAYQKNRIHQEYNHIQEPVLLAPTLQFRKDLRASE